MNYTRVLALGLAMLLVLSLLCMSVIRANSAQDRPLKIWYENENGMMQTYCVVDSITGVNYIVVSGELYGEPIGAAITPRLNADGTLYVTP